jgi:hypothetical protein
MAAQLLDDFGRQQIHIAQIAADISYFGRQSLRVARV